MVDTLKKIVGFLILTFLALNLVSCQQNAPTNPIATGTLPDKPAKTSVAQTATTTVVLGEEQTTLPMTQPATATVAPGEQTTTPMAQGAATATPVATSSLAFEAGMEIAGQWQRLDTTGGGGQTSIVAHPTEPDIVYMASDSGGLYKTENGWIVGFR